MSSFSFFETQHADYIQRVANDTSSYEYIMTQNIRMSGVYWGLTAMALLGRDLQVQMDMEFILNWLLSCQDPLTGGFGGNTNHDPHILYTLSALQILALLDKLDMEQIDKVKIAQYVGSLQQPDGSFYGDKWGEVDTRFSYCALSIL